MIIFLTRAACLRKRWGVLSEVLVVVSVHDGLGRVALSQGLRAGLAIHLEARA
jgi:hypothetical protein